MKSAAFVATGVLAISSTALAGPVSGYVGIALGTQPGLNQKLHDFANPMGRSLRGLGGARFGMFSVEAALNSFDVVTRGYGDRSVTELSLAAKLNVPIDNDFELFGRFGIEETWFDLGDDRVNFSGAGFLIGAGVAYRIKLTAVDLSLFVDYNIHQATLSNMVGDLEVSPRFGALGLIVGF
jgi:hypothetical protein